MGLPHPPPPVLFFCGLLISPGIDPEEIIATLVDRYGGVLDRGPIFPFDDSDYYTPEMGEGVTRTWTAFSSLVDDGLLPRIKLETNSLEERWMVGGNRQVNIDPGTLSHTRMVLATTKEAGHRIYLGEGMWGDLHYLIRGRGFEPLPWTYPDYRRPETIAWFNRMRDMYLELKKEI